MAFLPSPPDAGPFKRSFWRSPLRGPWLASFLSSALLPLIVICALTGFLSHAAYDTDLGENAVFGDKGGFDFYFFDWPSSPAWLYAVTQGLHIITGLAAIPILLAKLWAVIPKLFESPPVRSLAHGLERLGLALLVGGSLFVFATGVLNIQLWPRGARASVPGPTTSRSTRPSPRWASSATRSVLTGDSSCRWATSGRSSSRAPSCWPWTR